MKLLLRLYSDLRATKNVSSDFVKFFEIFLHNIAKIDKWSG